MLNNIRKYIISKFNNETDEERIINIYLIILFVITNCIWNFLIFILFIFLSIPEMEVVALINTISYGFCIYLGLYKKKIQIVQYILFYTICYYVVATSYYLGYYKDSFVLLVPIFFAMYGFSTVSKKTLLLGSISAGITYAIVIYFRYNVISIYENTLNFFEWINVLIGIVSLVFIIFAKEYSNKFRKEYRAALVNKISVSAYKDSYTGLWNRRYIENYFRNNELEYKSFIIFIEIDNYNEIEKNFGDGTSNYLFNEIAKVIKIYFGDNDICARWYVNEFFIYATEKTKDDLDLIYKNISKIIRENPLVIDNQKIDVTLSFAIEKVNRNLNFIDNINNVDKKLIVNPLETNLTGVF
ncbi:MAG: GGDEF domain-containing protein [Lachnospirales bacterium]